MERVPGSCYLPEGALPSRRQAASETSGRGHGVAPVAAAREITRGYPELSPGRSVYDWQFTLSYAVIGG